MGSAVLIEQAFDQLLGRAVGSRGGVADADVFRTGDSKALAAALEAGAAKIEERSRNLGLLNNAATNGSTGARISVAIDELRIRAADLKKSSGKPEGGNWVPCERRRGHAGILRGGITCR